MTDAIHLFVTADDRTGALEVGGALASETVTVPVGPFAESSTCCVVDLVSRHVSAAAAFEITRRAHDREAAFRSHKMDSGLRGNWPAEISALLALGHKVAVVPSFPDAGRRCKDGVVYIQDVPVLESPFAADPLNAPVSSKPVEVLEAAGCTGDVVVWDANDNDELAAAISRCHQESRVLVGPTGAVAGFAATVLPDRKPLDVRMPQPVLIVCGSLNAVSRQQIARLDCPAVFTGDAIPTVPLALLVTRQPRGPVSEVAAEAMAAEIAGQALAALGAGTTATLLVIGGDTTAAIVGDETLEVLGTVDTAIAFARFRGHYIVTKGGGIGTRDTLLNLLQRSGVPVAGCK